MFSVLKTVAVLSREFSQFNDSPCFIEKDLLVANSKRFHVLSFDQKLDI